MANLFDRLNQELEAFGRRAQTALDEGKLQIELLRLRRQRDIAARQLGTLVYRRERGGQAEPRRIDAVMLRLDDLEAEIRSLEARLREMGCEAPSEAAPEAEPVGTTADTAEGGAHTGA
jgi:50S ribosomal subunit-associated GTPase HflX